MRSPDGLQDLRPRAPEYLYVIGKGPELINEDTTRLLLQRAKDLLGACSVTNQRQEELTLSIEVRQECRSINERIQASLKKASAFVDCFVAGEVLGAATMSECWAWPHMPSWTRVGPGEQWITSCGSGH